MLVDGPQLSVGRLADCRSPSGFTFIVSQRRGILAMRGWLLVRHAGPTRRSARFFFRLRWAFLSAHFTELGGAGTTHFLDGATVRANRRTCTIAVTLSSPGAAFAAASTGVWFGLREPHFDLVASSEAECVSWALALQSATVASFFADFFPVRVLGRGASGEVWLANLRRNASVQVAVKRVDYALPRMRDVGARLVRIHRETTLQARAARHSRTVPAIRALYFDGRACYIAMDFANGGSLTKAVAARRAPLAESAARVIVARLAKCLLALHQAGVVHRDVKCDNVVLADDADGIGVQVRLIDFGLAAAWRGNEHGDIAHFCHKFVGTETYLAPEIANGMLYGAPVDVYALGVLCHVCLLGEFPFKGRSMSDTLNLIRQGELRVLRENRWSISPEGVRFCRALLHPRPETRLTAAGVLQHMWIRGSHQPVLRTRPGDRASTKTVFRRMFWAWTALSILADGSWCL